MRIKSALALGFILATVAAFATGCSAILVTDKTGGSSPGGGSGQTQATRGGELRLVSTDPPTLDPHIAGDVTSSEFILEVFSGLVKLNSRLEVVPELAERWTVSPDGREYTFTLKPDIRFHDGRPVTADDFKFSFERAMNPRTASPTVDAYLGDIRGAMDVIEGRATELSGFTIVDPQTIRITLAETRYDFLSKLTYPTSYVVDRNQLNRPNWFERPNATGPFRLTTYTRGDRIVLERNDRYAGDPQPSLARVVFFLSGAAITRYENDEIDISPVSLIDIDRVRDPRDPLSREFVEGAQLDTYYIGFNTQQRPFDDPAVRRALSHATDKRRIINVVLRDLVAPAPGILPPGMPGYDPNVTGLEFDAEAARRELAASRYRDVAGLGRITYSTAGTGASVGPVTEAVLNNWQQVLGIQVEIQQTEFAIFLQDLNTRRYQMFDVGWSADYPEPQNFLDLLLYSRSSQNTSGFSNPEYDRLIERARGEADRNTRFELLRQAERIAIQEAPWIPLYHGKTYEVVKPYVQGYQPRPMTIPWLAGISIDRR